MAIQKWQLSVELLIRRLNSWLPHLIVTIIYSQNLLNWINFCDWIVTITCWWIWRDLYLIWKETIPEYFTCFSPGAVFLWSTPCGNLNGLDIIKWVHLFFHFFIVTWLESAVLVSSILSVGLIMWGKNNNKNLKWDWKINELWTFSNAIAWLYVLSF